MYVQYVLSVIHNTTCLKYQRKNVSDKKFNLFDEDLIIWKSTQLHYKLHCRQEYWKFIEFKV